MNALKGLSRGVIAVAVVLVALGTGLLASSRASAQGETVSIGRLTAAVGDQGKVNLKALSIQAPGLGAWMIGVTYDPSIVAVAVCGAASIGINFCNPAFTPNRAQITGASGTGYQGDVTLASLTFRCLRTGTTSLTLTVDELADATQGAPRPIAAALQHGSIGCAAAAPPGKAMGDVNDDGVVNSVDAALVLQFEARLITALPNAPSANVNGDDRVNSLDAALILQLNAGLIHSLPV